MVPAEQPEKHCPKPLLDMARNEVSIFDLEVFFRSELKKTNLSTPLQLVSPESPQKAASPSAAPTSPRA